MNFTPSWTVERWLLVATFVASVLGFTFSIGANWARDTAQEARQSAFEQAVPATYLRADVYTSDQRQLTESINRLTRAIERLEENQRPSRPPVRQFDR